MAGGQDTLEWSISDLAEAMKITEADVQLYFTDGRKVSFIIERRLAYEIVHGKLAPSEGAGYDLIDKQGNKWEVRSITKDGVYFCPSYMVGSGRSFEEKGFLDKLAEIKGYLCADVAMFPKIPFWIIPKEVVRKWWNDKLLGTTTKVSRATALSLIKGMKKGQSDSYW